MSEAARVALLAETVVGQIAAGEVIERPASAAKELLENALDAGAGRIHVEVQGGGRSLIKVTDDGLGMSPTDALLCLKRHATSKLTSVDDLDDIRTLGFRGEGLSSIAAVSRLTLVTRRAGDSQGLVVESEAGQISGHRPAGCSPGTSVSARDLFFNTPGRLKFLKSTATEAGHITDVVSRLAHAFHLVHFTLLHDGRVALELPPRQDRLQRIQQLLGRRAERIHTAVVESPEARVAVCLAEVAQTVTSARSLTLLVNQRHVRDRLLLHAVRAGLGDRVDAGRYPVGVIEIDVPPAAVDVNVHPQKLEVRFADGARVYDAVRRCVHEAAGVVSARPSPQMARVYRLDQRDDALAARASDGHPADEAVRRFWSARGQAGVAEREDYGLGAAFSGLDRSAAWPPGACVDPAGRGSVRCIGRTMGHILICETAEQLLLVDERLAWRQVMQWRLSSALLSGALHSQVLDEPVLVSLPRDMCETVRAQQVLLQRLGFDVESFGGDGWVLRGIPQETGESGAQLFEQLIQSLSEAGRVDEDTLTARSVSLLADAAARRHADCGDVGLLLDALSRRDANQSLEVLRLSPVSAGETPILAVRWSDLPGCWQNDGGARHD